jgi:hypothetical protein
MPAAAVGAAPALLAHWVGSTFFAPLHRTGLDICREVMRVNAVAPGMTETPRLSAPLIAVADGGSTIVRPLVKQRRDGRATARSDHQEFRMSEDPRCCGSGTCIIDTEGRCWCGQLWDGQTMRHAPLPQPVSPGCTDGGEPLRPPIRSDS